VGKANGSRERAPDDKLRVPTASNNDSQIDGGHGAMRLCPPYSHRKAYPRDAVVEDGTRTGCSAGMSRVRSRLAGIAR
jgi:hypothetical protein